jgi:predicted ATPase
MSARLRRLVLGNWRNFKKVDAPLRQRAFFVGPNASGKTNLLDAIRFLRDIAIPGGTLVAAVRDRRGLKHIRSLHAGSNSRVLVAVEVEIEGDPEFWAYELELSGSESKNKPLRIEREVVRHGSRALLNRATDTETNELLLGQTHLEQISQSLKFRPLADALASVVHLHVVPQVARSPMRAEEFSKRDAPGSDFIDQIARLPERSKDRALRRIERLLRLAVPRFSELDVTRDQLGRPHLVAKYEHWRRTGGWQNEQEFSDGTLRLIGLLWAIESGTSPLILEEPELSLHRDVIRQLPRLLAQASTRSGRQVLVSTHAEEMLSDRGIDPAEVFLLEPSEYETKVVLGSEKSELVEAAKAKVPLGRLVTAITRPKDIEQLSLPLPSEK